MMRRLVVLGLIAAGWEARGEDCRWQVRDDTNVAEAVLVDLAIAEPRLEQSGDRVRPVIGGLSALGIPGAPDLPKAVRLMPAPEGRVPRVEVLSIQSYVTNGIRIPASPTPRIVETPEGRRVDMSDRTEDAAIYGKAEAWPVSPVTCEVAQMGTQSWARLVVHPMQIEPVSGILVIHTNVSLRIWWEREPES